MACHYRVAVATTPRSASPKCCSASFPAPAARSGCRACAAPALALEMCTDGKPVAAAQARTGGHRRRVIDGDLLEGAIAFAQARAAARRAPPRPAICRTGSAIAQPASRPVEAVRATLGKTARGARAPFAAVDAIEAGLTLDFDAGSRREMRAVRRLRRLDRIEGAAPPVLRRARGRQGPRRAERHADAATIKRAAVVGAGTMGGGIAMTLRERRHPGPAQGSGSGGARPRPGDDPQELRVDDVEGQDDAGGRSSRRWRSSRRRRPTTASMRSTSSSKRCSRTWT